MGELVEEIVWPKFTRRAWSTGETPHYCIPPLGLHHYQHTDRSWQNGIRTGHSPSQAARYLFTGINFEHPRWSD